MFYFPHLMIKLAGRSSSFSAETESPQLVRAVFPHQLDLFFCISQVCFSTPENHRNLVPEFHILVDYKVSTIWYFPKLAKLGYFHSGICFFSTVFLLLSQTSLLCEIVLPFNFFTSATL